MAWWVFQNLVATTALAVIVIAVCRVAKPGPVARHALWVLVLLKFVTPPIVEWPWTLPDPMGLADSAATSPDAINERVEPGPLAPAADDAVVMVAATVGDSGESAGEVVAPVRRVQWWTLLVLVWIGGSAWMLALESVRYRRLARRISASMPPDAATLARVQDMAKRLGVAVPRVCLLPGAHAPFIWSGGAATLVLPRDWPDDATSRSIDALIVHELAHLKRRDHYVAWMQLVAGVLWWWNPLFWYVRATVREQAELACDAWVVATLPDGRRAYAESLITLSGPALQGRSAPSMAAVVGADAISRRMLERRLVMIMKGRTPLHLPFTGLVTLALAAAATLPAWASAGQQAPPPPPPAPKPVMVVPPKAPDAPPAPVQRPAPKVSVPSPPVVLLQKRATPKPASAAPVWVENMVQRYTVTMDGKTYTVQAAMPKNLPEDARKMVLESAAEEEAMRAELQKRIDTNRAGMRKRLEALQEEHTKAGRLDEAVAIRDYLRSAESSRWTLPGWIKR